MKQLLKNLFVKYNIDCDEEKLNQFELYFNMVVDTNKMFNLTAITEKNDFAIKHILDCVLPAELLPLNAKIIDVGAGAGFPSIPLKIIRPDLKITMLDSLNKRVVFLDQVINELKLNNICACHGRAEDFAKQNREIYDIAIARAVANLTTLAEYCLPFVKVGGKFVALKGSLLDEELSNAKYAIQILGGEVDKIQKVYIEEIDSQRENLVVSKVKKTDSKYPRGKNLPRLKPLSL